VTRLRVVILTTYFRPIVGGVESTAERLARYLHAHGCSVQIVTKRIDATLPDVEDMDGVRVERIGPLGERSGSGKWRLVPAAARWLLSHRASYDIVCCVDYRGVGVAAIAARAVTGRPVVVQAQTTGVLSGANADALFGHWHLPARGTLSRIAKWPVLACYRRADAFACISREIEREAAAVGVPAERVHYLPNAVDMERFHPADAEDRLTARERYQVPAGTTVCLYVGRLSLEKGLLDLLEAWRLAAPVNAVLLVAGPDMVGHAWNVGPAARAFVERHHLGASTQFLGSITEVAPLLRVADVVVQPSHFEALGLSAIEALASGVPVIASAVGGLLDFIVDGGNGLLHPPQDTAALANCLHTLLDSPALRERLATRARPSVVDVYAERVVFARFAELLRHLARRHR
jgi:glycosyltransferase involved in cell wall biosynthesis